MAKTEKEWTIMVYFAGDNNLSENMAISLEDLGVFRQGLNLPETAKINLLAFFDSNSLTAPTHYVDFTDMDENNAPYRHRVQKSDRVHPKAHEKVVLKIPDDVEVDENSASACSIMNFVHWCVKTRNRPAKNYAIIFSGHSFGFHGTSFLRDDKSGSFMTLFRFRWALDKINDLYLNNSISKKIAVLGFDSCVMSMLEVGYELKDVAQTIVASEGSLPNSGWGYVPTLKQVIETIDHKIGKEKTNLIEWKMSPGYVRDVAKAFVVGFIEQQKRMALGGRSVDIAAWDLDEVTPIAEEVSKLALLFKERLYLVDKIQNNLLTDDDIFVFQHLKKIILQSHYDSQTYMKEQAIDLKDFCQRLIIECKFMETGRLGEVFSTIKENCKRIIPLIEACIIRAGFSGEEYQFSNGISIYFPWTYVSYFLTDYRYRYLRINKGDTNFDLKNPVGIGKNWNDFLFYYLTRVSLRGARKYIDSEGHQTISLMEEFSSTNPMWSKDNPIASKDNPIWSRDNPIASRDNPIASRDNPIASRDNPIASKDNPKASKGEVGEYVFYFSRFKNFQLSWDISGFSDEFKFDENFENDR